MNSSLPFERLSDSRTLLPFDCGDEDINDFFVSQALHYQNELLAVTYFLEDGENKIGFVSPARRYEAPTVVRPPQM